MNRESKSYNTYTGNKNVSSCHIVLPIVLVTRPETESESEYRVHIQNRNPVLVQNIYVSYYMIRIKIRIAMDNEPKHSN